MCVGGGGRYHRSVDVEERKRQMYEEPYVLNIHLGKRDVSFNELSKNQFQLVYWWGSGGERLGAEEEMGEVGTGPLRI